MNDTDRGAVLEREQPATLLGNELRLTITVEETSALLGISLRSTYRAVNAGHCLLYTSPSPRDLSTSRMPSSA